MGYVALTTLSSQAQAAIENASSDGVTQPIAAPSGYEIYRVTDRRSRDFSDVREELRSQLADQAREQEFEQWLGRRLRSADIVVNPKYGRFDARTLQIVPGKAELRP
jgi:parvulin-like peptidyl-prolyl isomerase